MFTKKIILLGIYLVIIPMISQGCAVAVDDCEQNACGSCGKLEHTPGDGCDGGIWTCESSGDIVCQPTETPSNEENACGGITKLEHTPGDGCKNGIWTCDGSDKVFCKEVKKNPCGGTGKLDQYGKDCGSCGKYQCDGTDALKCEDPGKNACGSCGALSHAPGDACDDGTWTCSGDGTLICKKSTIQTEPNACGGMTEITDELGADCGNCGKFECAGTDAMRCNDPGKNACEGCKTLEHTPGEACGECGQYVCDSNESVKCDDPGKNACGGCAPLTDIPGTKCGAGECAKWTCDGTDNVVCGSSEMNACGGCDQLTHKPGEKCTGEACCTWVCDNEHGVVIKDEHVLNACGGCGILEHDPGTKCDNGYGVWQCDTSDASKNSLKCTCETHNECGGCSKDQKKGDSCTVCQTTKGHLVCRSENLACADDSNTTDNAIELSRYTDLDDSMDDIQKWNGGILEDASDIDWYYIKNVKDAGTGMMQPQFWILEDKGYKLCAYILESRSPNSVNYTCAGTGKDEENDFQMKVSATYSDVIQLKDGRKFTGFCTKPSSSSSYKFIRFENVETPIVNNSLSVYISVSSDGTRKDACRNYELRYRF